MAVEILTIDKGLLDEIIKESNLDKLAERGIKSSMKELKKDVESWKKGVKDMIKEKRICLRNIDGILPLLCEEVCSTDYRSAEESKFIEFIDRNKYPLLSSYLPLNEENLIEKEILPSFEGKMIVIKREIIPEFNKEAKELKEELKPIIEQSIKKVYPSASDPIRKKLLELLNKDESICDGKRAPDMPYVTDIPYEEVYDLTYNLLKCSEFAKKKNLDMILVYREYKSGVKEIEIYVLDFNLIKSEVENQNYKYFETLIDKYYKKEYQASLVREKTELTQGSLGEAIANAIIGEALSRNYKSIHFTYDDGVFIWGIELYSEELGTNWDELANKDLGQGYVRSFSPGNAKKILKILKQMRERPKETADNINKVLAKDIFGEYKIDKQRTIQILDQLIDVVEESINKNLELVVCRHLPE